MQLFLPGSPERFGLTLLKCIHHRDCAYRIAFYFSSKNSSSYSETASFTGRAMDIVKHFIKGISGPSSHILLFAALKEKALRGAFSFSLSVWGHTAICN
jgi:hypothetical protein